MGLMSVILPNFVTISQTVADVSRFNRFLKMAAVVRIWITRDEYLAVSIIVQNLVAIDAVVLICEFQYFARLA